MQLVVAEKPSVAKEIARALGCTHREKGFFAGPTALVTYAIGHLVRFAEPDEMNPAWGKPWRRDALPMVPGAWKFVAEPGTKDQFAVVKRLMHDKRITQIVNATDAGREGEAIFRRIYALAEAKKPVLRFWTSSLTEEAIAEALQRLRPSAAYDNLASAALARAQLDWLIGMNHTRASTLNNHQLCSVGRVQTPTLAIVVERHHQIANFVKTPFYEVHAEMVGEWGAFVARALTAQGKYDFDERAQAERILAAVPEGTPAEVTAVEKKPKRTQPPQLHNLGELQKEANRRFGLTADRTLAVAQTLYEQKAISYPRSSSRYLSEDMVGGLPAVLKALHLTGREDAIAQARARATKGPKLSKRFVDGSKLSDHHAIIPTARPAPASLGQDERRIYTLVAERFLGIFLPDRETEETRIDVLAAGHRFRATGTRLVAPGWTILTGNRDYTAGRPDAEDDPGAAQSLPEVRKGEMLSVLDAEMVSKERKPPPRFTDASLLAAMETAGRDIDDDALREAMRGRGLGTEATRASILKRLLDLEYMVRDGKHFDPTAKGIALIAQLLAALPHLVSPELTGDMEAKLEQVEQGRLTAEDLLAEVAQGLQRDIPLAFGARPIAVASAVAASTPAAAQITAAKGELLCPKCRAGLLAQKPGQNFLGCARFREGCNFTLNTSVAGKRLTATQIRDLITKQRTKVISGFKSKAGKPFAAALVLGPASDWRTTFEFER